jgi:hypothetical protein
MKPIVGEEVKKAKVREGSKVSENIKGLEPKNIVKED